nr:hypothetical protein [Tanacetum cinerariifolium]
MLEKKNESAELKRCLEIIPEDDDDDDVIIEATPLSSKSLTIVDYKIYKERRKSYFKIIRVDGNSQNYLTFRKMFKNFNREDLKVLWSIVKTRFKKTKPINDMDKEYDKKQLRKTLFKEEMEQENIQTIATAKLPILKQVAQTVEGSSTPHIPGPVTANEKI